MLCTSGETESASYNAYGITAVGTAVRTPAVQLTNKAQGRSEKGQGSLSICTWYWPQEFLEYTHIIASCHLCV